MQFDTSSWIKWKTVQSNWRVKSKEISEKTTRKIIANANVVEISIFIVPVVSVGLCSQPYLLNILVVVVVLWVIAFLEI